MPLQKIQHIPEKALLGIWHIAETLDTLRQSLPAVYAVPVTKIHPSRQKEWMATRVLLQAMLPQQSPQIVYEALGKPNLNDASYQISISHSATHVAILLHPSADVGIDIEVIRPKIERLRQKFLGQREYQDLVATHPESLHERLTILWTAKESLYKLYGKKQLRFIENLPIHQDLPQQDATQVSGTLKASIRLPDMEQQHTLHYRRMGNQILTYVIDQQRSEI